MPRIRHLSQLLVLTALAACGGSDSLPDPTSENFVDTVTVGSLTDTPITTASGFSVSTGAVRTDLDPGFDFAYDIEGPPETGRRTTGGGGAGAGATVPPTLNAHRKSPRGAELP